MAQVIEKTQTDAYIDFVAKYPDIKIGQRTFDQKSYTILFFSHLFLFYVK
jgi:hypothetical protein